MNTYDGTVDLRRGRWVQSSHDESDLLATRDRVANRLTFAVD